jgi:hypothetical protein
MPKPTFNAKHQATVQIAPAEPASLKREGCIKVGPGDPVEDVRRARELIGLKGL